MTDHLGLQRSILPAAFESTQISGRISHAAAAATGLAESTPVVAGAGDQAASAVGNGIVESGAVSCTLGTSGVVFAHMDSPAYDSRGRVHTFCHAVEGAWHVMGVTQGAGLSLQWFRNNLARGRLVRGSHCRSRHSARWLSRAVLASLFDGRTDTSSRCVSPRRMDWSYGQTYPRRSYPGPAGRRVVQPEGLPRRDRANGRIRQIDTALGRRRSKSLLAADAGRCLRKTGFNSRKPGGIGLRRRPARDGGNRRVFLSPGGMQSVNPRAAQVRTSACGTETLRGSTSNVLLTVSGNQNGVGRTIGIAASGGKEPRGTRSAKQIFWASCVTRL